VNSVAEYLVETEGRYGERILVGGELLLEVVQVQYPMRT